VLALFEDVHWSDPTTRELLDLIVDRAPASRVLVLITFRPEFRPPWAGFAHVSLLTLSRLNRRQVGAMAERVAGGKALPPEVLEQIAAKTDGVPLFVEELTKLVLEAGLLQEEGDRYTLTGPLPPLAIPATLYDSLMARLDRLAPAREVAQIGAVIGREFSRELLAAVAGLTDERLAEAMARLAEAGLAKEEIARLSSPIGLDLGARTPEETAVSIAAEIIAGRWGGSGERLSGTEGPIHATAER
jgi:predicted ATPase